MEGDVLVVDEARSYGHADLVVAEVEGEYRLFKTHRFGSRCHLLPPWVDSLWRASFVV